MASDRTFVEYVCEQARAAGNISSRKMFGEYAIYAGNKIVGLVCDNQFFVKPTNAGRTFLGEPVEAPPYPGAKLHFLVNDHLDDQALITTLLLITEREVPEPKPKPAKKAGTRKRQ